MPDKRLYSCRIPEESQMEGGSENQRRVASQGVLDETTAVVKSVSIDANQRRVRAQFRAKYAQLMARELEELVSAESMSDIPYYGVGSVTPADGYYTVEQGTRRPVDPREPRLQEFTAVLTRAGSRSNQFRAIKTRRRQVDHPFGNDEIASIGIPSVASNVRWYDDESRTTETASPISTRTGEFGDVDVFDSFQSSIKKPVLIYDLQYSEVGRLDVRIWDDFGRTKFDADGTNRWQKVFRPDHEFAGVPKIDNSLVRVTFDAPANLGVETWDGSAGSWSAESLGTSDWELADVDIQHISGAVVRAEVGFRDTTVSPTATYRLNLIVNRGYQYPQWTRRESEQDPVPSGLVDLLDPVSNSNDYGVQPKQTLVSRQEVTQ